MQKVWTWFSKLPVRTLIAVVRLYQLTLSPIIGRNCRFQPTCSSYMIGALEKYGVWRGLWRGVYRIIRCNPFCKGGYDPP
jgi:putative membrane protein insertion efficiency factor